MDLPLHADLSFLAQRVEGFFATLTKRRLKHGVFRSVVDLQAAINRLLEGQKRQFETLPMGRRCRQNHRRRQTPASSVGFDPLSNHRTPHATYIQRPALLLGARLSVALPRRRACGDPLLRPGEALERITSFCFAKPESKSICPLMC